MTLRFRKFSLWALEFLLVATIFIHTSHLVVFAEQKNVNIPNTIGTITWTNRPNTLNVNFNKTILDDYRVGGNAEQYLDGDYVDSDAKDDTIRFEHTSGRNECDGNASEILYVGNSEYAGTQSETGWVGKFYFNIPGNSECDSLVTTLKVPAESAATTGTGKWFDRSTIQWSGKLFGNENTFGQGVKYVNDEGGCSSTISIQNFSTRGDRASLIVRKKNSTGQCVVYGARNLTLADYERRRITGYRYDNNSIIFLPQSLDINNEASLGTAEPYPARNKFYKQLPADDTRFDANQYWEFENGSWIDFDKGSGGRIFYDTKTLQLQACIEFGGGTCNGNFYYGGLVIVDETPPDIYEADNNGSSQQGGGTEALPSCESNNSGLFGMIACGFVGLIDGAIQNVFGIVESLLNVSSADLRQSEELKNTWSYFRALSTFLLLAVGMVMVISQALGGGK